MKTEKRPVSYHVSDDSYEWFTPQKYIDAARMVMGTIDLDPASTEYANKVVMASVFYNKSMNGLALPWFGNVWLNPPYNMPLIKQFIDRAINCHKNKDIENCIILTNNSTDTKWFHSLLYYPVCFTLGRIRFYSEDGKKLVTRQGQAIFYLGRNIDVFYSQFSSFGKVLRLFVDD